ncbi:hypothetical protein [Catenuloplanes sp. NPDC020197]|uniref:hypothetical protein n=1 Tax=Catenuloplanes sp. NPDC020197 TaxID=3363958 RepID=UPI003789D1B6
MAVGDRAYLVPNGGDVFLVVVMPGGGARWRPVADVLLWTSVAGEAPVVSLARYPGVSAVARIQPGGGVTLVDRHGRIAAIAGSGVTTAVRAGSGPAGPDAVSVVRAVMLLRSVTRQGRSSSSRLT